MRSQVGVVWETCLGTVAIDWVAGRFSAQMELLRAGLNVQSGHDKPAAVMQDG